MITFKCKIEQSEYTRVNLFDLLFEKLKNRRYLFNLSEKSKKNLNQYNREDYTWKRSNKKEVIQDGEITTDYELNNKKTFYVFFNKDPKDAVYAICLYITPVVYKTVFIREFSLFFDDENVSWNNVHLEKHVSDSIEKDSDWYRFEGSQYITADQNIVHPKYRTHDGIWYYGKIKNKKFEEILKIEVVISPRIKEVINKDDSYQSLNNNFSEYDLSDKIDKDCYNKFTWILYAHPANARSPSKMIEYFEKEIIRPLTVEYFDNYLSLFRAYIFYRNQKEEDGFALKIRDNVNFLKKNWYNLAKTVKDNIEKNNVFIDHDDDVEKYDAIDEIKKILDHCVEQGDLSEEFSSFLKNEFFSFNKATILNKTDLDNQLEDGTYILKFTDRKKLSDLNSYSKKGESTVHIPSYVDPLKNDVQHTTDYNNVYMAVYIIYYMKQKMHLVKEIEKKPNEIEYVKITNGSYEKIKEIDEKQEVFSFVKTPSLLSNFNDKFFGYYIEPID